MRRALVTGAARGIGRQIATVLAEQGLEVFGADLRRADDVPYRLITADLTDGHARSALLEEVGPVDILVNNAGIAMDRRMPDTTESDLDATFAINVKVPFLLAQAVSPHMTASGWGRIINIGSVAARTGGTVSNSLAYAASKAALMSITRSLARELGPAGVLVNSVVPGAIATEMAHAGRSEELKAQMAARIALRRFGDVDEVAQVVAFLCSEASSFISGAAIDVNGGWYMA